MESSPLISIIIPIYNVRDYLKRCFDTISSQTYTNLEAIVIDDGSTDGSGDICDLYAAKDSRFKVFHKQNGGVSSARNMGLQYARGEWVTFCDSDDGLFDNALSLLVSCVETGIDSVCAGYVKLHVKQKKVLRRTRKFDKVSLEREQALMDFYRPTLGKVFNGYIINRLFNNAIIQENHLRFREDIFIKEDGLFLVQYLCSCKGLHTYIPNPIYKYCVRSGSATTYRNKQLNKESISNLYARIECYKEIKKVSDAKQLLNLSKDNISFEYLILTYRYFTDNLRKIKSFVRFSIHTFKYVSPFYILRFYFKNMGKL